MIPRIIHHIAPNDQSLWHPFWHKCRQSWLDQFFTWDFILWNDQDDIDRLVYDHYKQYWNTYKSFSHHIMRIDFARLCLLHRHGGLYADMDYYCYQNFEHDLTEHSIYFVENLTEEFTSATVENSLMGAECNSPFFLHTMNYSKACFIQFRNRFSKNEPGKNWRSYDNDFCVNNSTGSGMLSVARDSFGNQHFDIGHLNTAQFNNRPSSYAPWYKAKHVHTSLWGEDQVRSDRTREILIADGNACTMETVPDYAKQRLSDTDHVVDFESYDFYTDYTHNKYLQRDNSNLKQVKTWICESKQHTAEIMTHHENTSNNTSDSTS
jgi:hypothetical protein